MIAAGKPDPVTTDLADALDYDSQEDDEDPIDLEREDLQIKITEHEIQIREAKLKALKWQKQRLVQLLKHALKSEPERSKRRRDAKAAEAAAAAERHASVAQESAQPAPPSAYSYHHATPAHVAQASAAPTATSMIGAANYGAPMYGGVTYGGYGYPQQYAGYPTPAFMGGYYPGWGSGMDAGAPGVYGSAVQHAELTYGDPGIGAVMAGAGGIGASGMGAGLTGHHSGGLTIAAASGPSRHTADRVGTVEAGGPMLSAPVFGATHYGVPSYSGAVITSANTAYSGAGVAYGAASAAHAAPAGYSTGHYASVPYSAGHPSTTRDVSGAAYASRPQTWASRPHSASGTGVTLPHPHTAPHQSLR